MEDILKKIVQEIIRDLGQDVQVNENFVRYYVDLLILDPNWGINRDCLQYRSKIQRFVGYCTSKLANSTAPDILTLKLQFFFRSQFSTRNESALKSKREVLASVTPLENELLNHKDIDSETGIAKFYKMAIYYITLISGMGNPTLEPVYNEVEAAVKSILFETELRDFVNKIPNLKKARLAEINQLIIGIRLYNRDCNKGGEGIDDLSKVIRRSLDVTKVEYRRALEAVLEHINVYTTVLDNIYVFEENEDGKKVMVLNLPEDITEDVLEHLKDLLVLFRQYETYVKKLEHEVNALEDRVTGIEKRFAGCLSRLHGVLKNRIAVPANLVFPLFIDVSYVWTLLQDETLLLAKLNHIFSNIGLYIKHALKSTGNKIEAFVERAIGREGPLTNEERFSKLAGCRLEVSNENCLIIKPMPHIDSVYCKYIGYCAWKIFAAEGALLPGNKGLGILKFNDMNFAFSAPEAATLFAERPLMNFYRAINLVRIKPHLINYLKMHAILEKYKEIERLIPPEKKVIITCPQEMQTDIHPKLRQKNPKYMWNVWDIKREAVHLAYISRCRTVSTQTEECGGLKPVKTQTYEKKTQITQTKVDNYSNVPKPTTFIYGLRGQRGSRTHVINLTLPADKS